MDDPALVRRLESIGDPSRDRDGLVESNGPLTTIGSVGPSTSSMTIARAACLSLSKGLPSRSVDDARMFMVQRREDFGSLEASEMFRIARDRGGSNL